MSLIACLTLCFSLHISSTQTLKELGSLQGVDVRDGKVYLYGDADPGVIREYTADAAGALTPTGRAVRLTVGGKEVIEHPTGLTHHPVYGTYLGNTVQKKGTLYHLDWERLWQTGTLDGAVLNTVVDDAAVQGSRPEFVRYAGRWYLATSDYGNVGNEVRIYDPVTLANAHRTLDAGVMLVHFPTGPWVQSLHWLDARGLLVLVQNTTEGLGWRLSFVDLAASLKVAATITRQATVLPPGDELEGFHMLDGQRGYGVSSSEADNVRVISFAPPSR